VALLAIAIGGCKSGDGANTGDAAASDGPLTCGDATCTAGQLCVGKQNCGALTCNPLPDGGVCPPGSTATSSCPDGGPPGCFAGCPAAQFSCAARPGGCAELSCACTATLCAPGTCIATMGERVACETR
jgi:hypothetical protein